MSLVRNTFARLFFGAVCAAWLAGCSLPTLEEPECAAAKGVAKEFYSFHFANDMRFSPENLDARRKYLSPAAVAALPAAGTDADVFTTGDADYPKAFRIGGCRVSGADSAEVEVLLFWKTDTRTEQRAIRVSAVRLGERWLIDRFYLK